MALQKTNQVDFSGVLFDTLFGLILYFGIDALLEIKDPFYLAFYIFNTVILIHWWLIFKSADDAFASEVENSLTDILVGLVELFLMNFMILFSKNLDYQATLYCLIALLSVDLVWALLWKYTGEWKTKNKYEILTMEVELTGNIRANTILLALSLLILLAAIGGYLLPYQFIAAYILIYALYAYLTFKYRIIDVKIF